jgi:hypothetical protein
LKTPAASRFKQSRLMTNTMVGVERMEKGNVGPGVSISDFAVRLVYANRKSRRHLIMQYMLLIHHERDRVNPADQPQMMQEYMVFTQELVKSGKFKAGDRLESSNGTRTVRVRNGKTVTTDGPFAETKEQLGGYYIVDAKDLDEATSIAARIPGARTGSIEVREVAVMPPR